MNISFVKNELNEMNISKMEGLFRHVHDYRDIAIVRTGKFNIREEADAYFEDLIAKHESEKSANEWVCWDLYNEAQKAIAEMRGTGEDISLSVEDGRITLSAGNSPDLYVAIKLHD